MCSAAHHRVHETAAPAWQRRRRAGAAAAVGLGLWCCTSLCQALDEADPGEPLRPDAPLQARAQQQALRALQASAAGGESRHSGPAGQGTTTHRVELGLATAPAQVPGLGGRLHGGPWASAWAAGGAWSGMPLAPSPTGAHPAHAYPTSAWQGLPPVRRHDAAAPLGALAAPADPNPAGLARTDELHLRLSLRASKPYEHLRGGQLVRLDLGAATALSLRPRGGRVLVQLHSRW